MQSASERLDATVALAEQAVALAITTTARTIICALFFFAVNWSQDALCLCTAEQEWGWIAGLQPVKSLWRTLPPTNSAVLSRPDPRAWRFHQLVIVPLGVRSCNTPVASSYTAL